MRPYIAMAAVFLSGCGSGGLDIRTPPPEEPPSQATQDPPSGWVCDAGDSKACSALGGSWQAGTARCRADESGWDVSSCVLASPGAFEMVKPVERDPVAFGGALCNDGSAFGMEVRLAPQPSSVWMIYLEGGMYCDDVSFPCSQRPTALSSSPTASDGELGPLEEEGLMSSSAAANPDYYDQNQVFAYYCSSDFWGGATVARRPSTGDPERGWYFAGRTDVDAIFRMLVARYGLDDSDPSISVLFAGGSAGAWGVEFNAPHVADLLPNASQSGRLKLFLDAGWLTDWDDPAYRIGTATMPDRDVWRMARDYWGAVFNPDCEAARPSDPSSCFTAPTWYPFVATRWPTLVQQSTFDASFTAQMHDLSASDPAAVAWRQEVNASLGSVDWLFSGRETYHTLGIFDQGMMMGPPGSSLAQVIDRFLKVEGDDGDNDDPADDQQPGLGEQTRF